MMVGKVSSCTQVNKAPKENLTSLDDSTGEVKFTNDGEGFPFDAFLAGRPGLKFS